MNKLRRIVKMEARCTISSNHFYFHQLHHTSKTCSFCPIQFILKHKLTLRHFSNLNIIWFVWYSRTISWLSWV